MDEAVLREHLTMLGCERTRKIAMRSGKAAAVMTELFINCRQ
ncbi:MAG: hypothetical protein R3F53_22410 [Gammaproteobacteria bacterium]